MMNSPLLWGFSVAIPRLSPAVRLAQALDAASMRGIRRPVTILVHPETARDSAPLDGVTLVARNHVGRFDYFFEREGE